MGILPLFVSNRYKGYTDEVGQKADEFFEIGLNFN